MIKKRNIYVIIISIIVCLLIYILIYLNRNSENDNWFTDNFFGNQWYLYNNGVCSDIIIDKEFCLINKFKKGIDINIMPVWKKNIKVQKNIEIIVALIDTGVDCAHEDLVNNIWINESEIPLDGIDNDNNGYIDDINGWNFCENSNNLLSGIEVYENDHGTCCAGIIAAEHNEIGISGIAGNYNIKIMSIKVLEGLDHAGKVENLIKGIDYAQKNGAKICNLSLGISKDNNVESAIEYFDNNFN